MLVLQDRIQAKAREWQRTDGTYQQRLALCIRDGQALRKLRTDGCAGRDNGALGTEWVSRAAA